MTPSTPLLPSAKDGTVLWERASGGVVTKTLLTVRLGWKGTGSPVSLKSLGPPVTVSLKRYKGHGVGFSRAACGG
jgi:hypothetical protein